MVEGRESRVKCRESRVKCRESRVKCRGSSEALRDTPYGAYTGLGFWEVICDTKALSPLSRMQRKLLSAETCTLTFISRYSRLLSPFRTVQQYSKP